MYQRSRDQSGGRLPFTISWDWVTCKSGAKAAVPSTCHCRFVPFRIIPIYHVPVQYVHLATRLRKSLLSYTRVIVPCNNSTRSTPALNVFLSGQRTIARAPLRYREGSVEIEARKPRTPDTRTIPCASTVTGYGSVSRDVRESIHVNGELFPERWDRS